MYARISSRLSLYPAADAMWLLPIQINPYEFVVPPPTLSAFSRTSGRIPFWLAASAAAKPAMPVPRTMTSYSLAAVIWFLALVLFFNEGLRARPGGRQRDHPAS